jgi:ABC-type transport system involved in cytochrome c biogenesis permease component
MNWKTFFAMLARDVHVARRNFMVLLMQTFLQPLMFVFIFGRVMVRSGYMPEAYKSLLLPGIMAISMVFTGVWAVAMPLIAEFQFTREIEDRLLAPMEISWVAIEKVLAGTLQALIAGLVVIPAAWIILRPGVSVTVHNPLTFCLRYLARGAVFSLRWSGPGLQRQSAAHRVDVQHGFDPHDFLWLYLLPLERTEQLSHPTEGRAGESSCTCE